MTENPTPAEVAMATSLEARKEVVVVVGGGKGIPWATTKKAEEGDEFVKVVKMHPIVAFSILDHYQRRNEGQERVIGTLLGVVGEDGEVEVTNCFAVPHSEKDGEVAVGQATNKAMYTLLSRINNSEKIVGWYATTFADGTKASESSTLIHDFYVHECENPVHVVVDTCLTTEGGVAIDAFTSGKLGAPSFASAISGGEAQVAQDDHRYVHSIPMEIVFTQAEYLCFEKMIKEMDTTCSRSESVTILTHPDNEHDGLDRLEDSLDEIVQLINYCLTYVEDLIACNKKPNADASRHILAALATLPKIDPIEMDAAFNAHTTDLVIVTYLAQITKTQLTIAAKIHSTF